MSALCFLAVSVDSALPYNYWKWWIIIWNLLFTKLYINTPTKTPAIVLYLRLTKNQLWRRVLQIITYSFFKNNTMGSSRSQMFFKIGVLNNFAIFTGKHLCWSLLFNKVAGLRPANSLQDRLQQCFPANFAKLKKKLLFL